MNRFGSMLGSAAAVALGLFTLTYASTGAAEIQQLCQVYGGISDGESFYCISEDGLGMLGQLTLVGTNRVNVAVRQFPGLRCGANAWNELGDYVGGFSIGTAEGAVNEACFPTEDGSCYDVSPIVTVEFTCFRNR
jgi:hypothetical protein